MKPVRIVVFCDFDGTVARADVGYHMFHHFSGGRCDDLLPDWKSGVLSTRDCLLREAAMIQAPAETIYRFLDRFEIDDTFVEFERLCRANDVPVVVVSEGLDFYIKHILSRYSLAHLPLLCNHGRIENDRLHIEFPHTNTTCRRCGSCKGERIAEYRRAEGGDCRVVFVGDGYSDACAAKEADLLFAKKDLQHYCLTEKIPYNRYGRFCDVTSQLIRQRLLVT